MEIFAVRITVGDQSWTARYEASSLELAIGEAQSDHEGATVTEA